MEANCTPEAPSSATSTSSLLLSRILSRTHPPATRISMRPPQLITPLAPWPSLCPWPWLSPSPTGSSPRSYMSAAATSVSKRRSSPAPRRTSTELLPGVRGAASPPSGGRCMEAASLRARWCEGRSSAGGASATSAAAAGAAAAGPAASPSMGSAGASAASSGSICGAWARGGLRGGSRESGGGRRRANERGEKERNERRRCLRFGGSGSWDLDLDLLRRMRRLHLHKFRR